MSGRGGLLCSVRLSAQLDILRLITRGLDRNRRGSRRRSVISCRVCVSARVSRVGGKSHLAGGLPADDAQGAGEGHPVRVLSLVLGGLVHEVAQGVVHEEEREDLLLGPDRMLGAQDEAGTAQVGFDLVDGRLAGLAATSRCGTSTRWPPRFDGGRRIVDRRPDRSGIASSIRSHIASVITNRTDISDRSTRRSRRHPLAITPPFEALGSTRTAGL